MPKIMKNKNERNKHKMKIENFYYTKDQHKKKVARKQFARRSRPTRRGVPAWWEAAGRALDRSDRHEKVYAQMEIVVRSKFDSR